MADVKFSSCTNLPSALACCQLDYESGDQFGQNIAIQDFILLKTISSGAFGKVVLARKKKTNDVFAIKVLDKAVMVEKNVQEFVINERDVLNLIDNDFIVRGIYTFQSRKYLYMVMEYMKGGDFGTLLERAGCFNYERAKFYLAHVVAALEHLHLMGIVHRDLKPDNMLIGSDGHVKLTDFGLSEAGMRKMMREATAGPNNENSPGFLAPMKQNSSNVNPKLMAQGSSKRLDQIFDSKDVKPKNSNINVVESEMDQDI